jgi:hypothetical protein
MPAFVHQAVRLDLALTPSEQNADTVAVETLYRGTCRLMQSHLLWNVLYHSRRKYHLLLMRSR